MHDHFILVEGGIGGLFSDIVKDGLIGSPSVEQTQAIESTAIRVVIHTIASIIFRKEFGKYAAVFMVLVDKAQWGNAGELVPMGALGSPFQVLFYTKESVILGEGL